MFHLIFSSNTPLMKKMISLALEKSSTMWTVIKNKYMRVLSTGICYYVGYTITFNFFVKNYLVNILVNLSLENFSCLENGFLKRICLFSCFIFKCKTITSLEMYHYLSGLYQEILQVNKIYQNGLFWGRNAGKHQCSGNNIVVIDSANKLHNIHSFYLAYGKSQFY